MPTSPTPSQGTTQPSNPFTAMEASPDVTSSPAGQTPEQVAAPASQPSRSPSPDSPAAGQTTDPVSTSDSVATPAAIATSHAQPGLSREDLVASVVAGVNAQARASQPAAPQQQMTQEQFNAHYGIPNIGAREYEAVFGVAPDRPERVQALNQMIQAMVRPSVLMAQDLYKAEIAQMRQELTGQISPLITAHQAAQEQHLVTSFYQGNPDLQGEEALVNEVRDAMIARGQKFTSPQEMQKEVATKVRTVLGQIRAKGTGQPAGAAPAKPSTRQMSPSSQGGRGGSGATSASSKPAAELIFGS